MLVWSRIGWEVGVTALSLLALIVSTRRSAQLQAEWPGERETTLFGLAALGIIALAIEVRALAGPGVAGELLAVSLMIGGVGLYRLFHPVLEDLKLGVSTRARDLRVNEHLPTVQIMIRRFETAYAQVLREQFEAESAARRPLSTHAIRRLSIVGIDIELGHTTVWRLRDSLLSIEACCERLRAELKLVTPVARTAAPRALIEPPITVIPPRRAAALTPATWATSLEPVPLMQHIATRIPRRHLALIVADLAATVWPLWHRAFPDDWSFSLRVAALRGWAVGEVSLVALASIPTFEDEDGRPWLDFDHGSHLERPELGAGAAVAAALELVTAEDPTALAVRVVETVVATRAAGDDVAAARNYEAWVEALDAESAADWARDDSKPDEIPFALLAAEEERREAEATALRASQRAWRDGLTAATADVTRRIRSATPFRAESISEWRVVPEFVISGGALLRLEDGAIVDSALVAALGGVDAERAVAFDAALERGGLVLFQSG